MSRHEAKQTNLKYILVLKSKHLPHYVCVLVEGMNERKKNQVSLSNFGGEEWGRLVLFFCFVSTLSD